MTGDINYNDVLAALLRDTDDNIGGKTLAPNVTGGSLANVAWSVDNSQPVRVAGLSTNTEKTLFAPNVTSYTIPIITISGSRVSDTGNTSTAQPISYTSSTRQDATAEPQGSASQGGGLSDIIIPVAIIGGIAVLGTTLIDVLFGGKK